jgi:hypothetical protein
MCRALGGALTRSWMIVAGSNARLAFREVPHRQQRSRRWWSSSQLWLASGDHDHHEQYSDYGNDDPEASHVWVSLTGARRHRLVEGMPSLITPPAILTSLITGEVNGLEGVRAAKFDSACARRQLALLGPQIVPWLVGLTG